MFGWINDCTECLVLSKFGQETWHKIKQKANCTVEDGGFLRYKYYPDSDTVALVVATSEVIGISVDDVLFAFGDYFIEYVQDNGYSNVLECLGSNLRDWLSNLNSLHDHLQASYPKGFVAPVFWCEDDDSGGTLNVTDPTNDNNDTSSTNSKGSSSDGGGNNKRGDGAILVHYFSHRGSLLVPIVVGLIKKLARVYFDIEINMEQLQIQDEKEGVKHTSWRVTTVNPEESYKLRGKKKHKRKENSSGGDEEETIATTVSRYERTFREGGTQAHNLRVEEYVKRSYHNPNCELYHALTLEQYVYLCAYWKLNQSSDGIWCYETWSIQDDDGGAWVTLDDLPSRLNPATISEEHFGGKAPKTGAYPPDDKLNLQSFPPKIRVMNDITGKSQDLVTVKDSALTLEEAIYNRPEIEQEKLKEFPPQWQEQLDSGAWEIKCAVWNDEIDDAYHIFSLEDLKTTSTKQLYELVPESFDPIKILLQCEERVQVDDDEEDI
jgi:hypothetical protein